MQDFDADSIELLREARVKAQRLLEELLRQQEELKQTPPPLDQARLEAGRAAMNNAVEAARRTLANIEAALKIASTSLS